MVASLRVKIGQVVAATDGQGRIYEVRITRVKGNVAGEVERVHEIEMPRLSITLYLGILKQRAMEAAVGTGAKRICPCAYSKVSPNFEADFA